MRARTKWLGAVVVALLAGGPLASAVNAAPFTVTSAADAGPGTLRQAILDANAATGADTISFAIGTGQRTIIVSSGPLPTVTDPVVIDATTQPGFAGTPLVRLHNGTGSQIAGLDITAGSSQVRGLRITRFGVGVRLASAGGNTVAGNWIGLSASGTADGNGTGVLIESGSNTNTVGGTTAADRNLISGNTSGVAIDGTTDNVVEGNYVGTNKSGSTAVANATGVVVRNGATTNTIGGTTAAARNVISGNATDGVQITGGSATANTVSGNRIGTNAGGTAALPNATGVVIEADASANTVGGSTAGERNLISGNGDYGVDISAFNAPNFTPHNVVAGNYIGTNAVGTAALANGTGVFVTGAANTIGGGSAAQRNVISGNTTDGVLVDDIVLNVVAGNRIGTNAAGNAPLPNSVGLHLLTVEATTVGGTSAGERNVISGNTTYGVLIEGATPMEGFAANAITGNYIGTDLKGAFALPNNTGLRIQAAQTRTRSAAPPPANAT